MTELDAPAHGVKNLNRRTVLKGAAWSVPVIAAAVTTPLAAASAAKGGLDIDGGCLQVAGIQGLSGFTVTNKSVDTYTGLVKVTEKIDLSAITGFGSSIARSLIWAITTVTGITTYASPGVVVGDWVGQGGSSWGIVGAYKTATRTITYPATAPSLTSNADFRWGQLVNLSSLATPVLNLLLGGSGTWTADITDPTGNPPVIGAHSNLDWQLISGCGGN